MYFDTSATASPASSSYVPSTRKQGTVSPKVDFNRPADTFTKSSPAKTSPSLSATPKFGGWGKILMGSLPFVEAGLNLAQNNLDRSMQRDAERAERRRYERRKHERYEKLGTSFTEYDGRGHYRTVTPVTLKDGNGKTLDRYERVSNWHRLSRRR